MFSNCGQWVFISPNSLHFNINLFDNALYNYVSIHCSVYVQQYLFDGIPLQFYTILHIKLNNAFGSLRSIDLTLRIYQYKYIYNIKCIFNLMSNLLSFEGEPAFDLTLLLLKIIL